jgi:hypothetical protein
MYSSLSAVVAPTTSVVIGTDCIGSCKSNYHMITAMITPCLKGSKLELFYAYPQPLDREIIQPGLYIKATQENLKMWSL